MLPNHIPFLSSESVNCVGLVGVGHVYAARYLHNPGKVKKIFFAKVLHHYEGPLVLGKGEWKNVGVCGVGGSRPVYVLASTVKFENIDTRFGTKLSGS